MITLPEAPELEEISRKVVWFKPPRQAIADTYHFIAHVLTYGTFDDVAVLRRFLSQDDLVDALDHAPPGVMDPRSWAYWNLKVGRFPPPPMPQRKIS